MMSTDAAIVTGVRSLWEQGHFQDFTIQVEDHSFRVHKLIMASVSDYFHAMLTGGMAESMKDTVQVGMVTAAAMEKLINLIYKDKMELTKDNVADVLDAAMYLQIPTAAKVCVDFMVKNTNPKDCNSLLSIFRGYSLKDGMAEVQSYIKSNISAILDVCEKDDLQYEEFDTLVDSWQGSEMDLYSFMKNWVDVDHENRTQYFNDLLCKIRYCLMSPEELESIQDTDVYNTCLGSWHKLVHEAVEYHKLQLCARVLHDSEQSTLRSKPRLLCLYQDDDYQCAATLDEKRHWVELDLSIPEDASMPYTAIGVNNFLLITPKPGGDSDWYIFDPRTISWSQLPPVIRNKTNFPPVYHKGYLYVIAGSEDGIVYNSVERYNFQTNEWSSFVDLPDTREFHAACVYQDCIYISGGRHEIDGSELDKVDSLNLDAAKWESRPPMVYEAGEHLMCVMKLEGKEVMAVLNDEFKIQYHDVSSDQWTVFYFDHFEYIFPDDTSSCAVFAHGNTVYFVDEQKEGVWMNSGRCLAVTFPEEGNNVYVSTFRHFKPDCENQEYYFWTHGAVLSLPDHKLPVVDDNSSEKTSDDNQEN